MNPLKNDFQIDIATGGSRLAKRWRNERMAWSELVSRCENPVRTAETVAEYKRMTKEQQSNIKDVGGFVGGYLNEGVRKSAAVRYRSCATLDLDYATADVWDDFTERYDCAALLYSTHKHTPEAPRLRLVIPFDHPLNATDYEAVCRRIAQRLGIDMFDTSTYQAARLFYLPSVSRDGQYVFEVQDGAPLDTAAVLATYVDPADASAWPIGSREADVVVKEIKKAGDPTAKAGVIGAFCRAYTIEDAIDTFLPDIYEPTATEGRYTYRLGSVAGGLVCYDGKYAYSHHETDPAGQQLCNAFDLVRVHLFGIQDEGSRAADITRKPSYGSMLEFAGKDPKVCKLLFEERTAQAAEDFAGVDVEDAAETPDPDQWKTLLKYDAKTARLLPEPANFDLIMDNDPNFKTIIYDTFSQRNVLTDPNSIFAGTHAKGEVDDTSLARMRHYMGTQYRLDMQIQSIVERMLNPSAPRRAVNLVEQYIRSKTWDGKKRCARLFIDYLGAEDSKLVENMTRKWLAGAVGRAIDTDPDTGEGIKFDYCITLLGEQGTGKSTMAEILAGRWRGAISLNEGKKEQCETLLGSWLVEIPEFKGMKGADVDSVKDLISRRSDDFRAAYARTRAKNPRHCVFIGSTNNEYFLKDTTGNRRFWVLPVKGKGIYGEISEWAPKLREEVGQIWAEAYHIYKSGEPLMLDQDDEKEMRARVEKYTVCAGDPMQDALREWLDTKLPMDWDTWPVGRKLAFYRNFDPLDKENTVTRMEVSLHEIFTQFSYPGVNNCSGRYIGEMLKMLGWEQIGRIRVATSPATSPDKDGRGQRTTVYRRPQKPPEPAKVDDADL